MSDPWHILFCESPKDWYEAARLLAEASPALGLADATVALRSDGGLVPYALSREEAARVAGALSAAGYAAIAIPARRVVIPPAPLTIGYARPTEEGLSIRADWLGSMRLVPWEWMRLWRVALVREPSSRARNPLWKRPPGAPRRPAEPDPDAARRLSRDDLLEAGQEVASLALSLLVDHPVLDLLQLGRFAVAAREARTEATMEPVFDGRPPPRPAEPEVLLELFALDPPLRLRIRHHAFDYRGLDLGPVPAARLSFAELVRRVASHLPEAQATGLTEDAAAGRDLAALRRPIEAQQHELAVIGWLTRLALREAGATAPPC